MIIQVFLGCYNKTRNASATQAYRNSGVYALKEIDMSISTDISDKQDGEHKEIISWSNLVFRQIYTHLPLLASLMGTESAFAPLYCSWSWSLGVNAVCCVGTLLRIDLGWQMDSFLVWTAMERKSMSHQSQCMGMFKISEAFWVEHNVQ